MEISLPYDYLIGEKRFLSSIYWVILIMYEALTPKC